MTTDTSTEERLARLAARCEREGLVAVAATVIRILAPGRVRPVPS